MPFVKDGDKPMEGWRYEEVPIGPYVPPPSMQLPHVPLYKDITLRDWFAGIVAPEILRTVDERDMTLEEAAAFAYRMADAMLKARGGK